MFNLAALVVFSILVFVGAILTYLGMKITETKPGKTGNSFAYFLGIGGIFMMGMGLVPMWGMFLP